MALLLGAVVSPKVVLLGVVPLPEGVPPPDAVLLPEAVPPLPTITPFGTPFGDPFATGPRVPIVPPFGPTAAWGVPVGDAAAWGVPAWDVAAWGAMGSWMNRSTTTLIPQDACCATTPATSPQYWSSDPASRLCSCETLPSTLPLGRVTVQAISTCCWPFGSGETVTWPFTVKSVPSGVTCTSGPSSARSARIRRVSATLPSPGAPVTSGTKSFATRFSRLFGSARSRVARTLIMSANTFGTASCAASPSVQGAPAVQLSAGNGAPSIAPCSCPEGSRIA